MAQEDSLKLWWCNLKASDFDQVLLSINYIPGFGLEVAIHHVASVIEVIGIERIISGRVIQVSRNYGRASDTELSSDIEGCDISTGFVNKSAQR